MRERQTYDLLLPIFNGVSKTFEATDVTDNSDGTFTLNTCNTLWLHPAGNRVLSIDNVDYSIEDIEPNEWVKLRGSIAPALTFDIYPPSPFHGTVLAQNELLNQIENSKDKLPMIWLHEITRETFEASEELLADRESDCDIYFMTDANLEQWITPDHDKYAIKPMRNLCMAFIEQLENEANVDPNFKFEVFDHANFGVYLESKGHVRTTFNDKMSGTQLRITIQFNKDLNCTC